MQKKSNCILEEYVSKTIGLSFTDKGSAKDLVKGLPRYLKEAFRFSLVEIEGQDFLLVLPSTEIDLPVSQTVKFADQIRRQTGKPTLIQFESMNNIRRRTLISRRENFVVPERQIYIPSLRMYLNEVTGIRQFSGRERLSPSAQLLLLYHLQKTSLEGLPFKDMAEILSYSKKTISVVAEELQKLSVCEVESMNERNKVLHFKEKGRELWDKVSPLMDSPVQKVWYTGKDMLPDNLPLSCDTALAHYTFMVGSPQTSLAIDRKLFPEYQKEMRELLHPEEGDVRLEVWKYNPALLANGQYIDSLSLALCYKNTDDERIKKEITKLIDNTTW
jgi:DNA-binding MarR family transcriptional regulator